jgi:hypothetical protein
VNIIHLLQEVVVSFGTDAVAPVAPSNQLHDSSDVSATVGRDACPPSGF